MSEGWSRAERAEQRRASCSSDPQPLGRPAQVDGPGEPAHLRDLVLQGSEQRTGVLSVLTAFAGSIPCFERVTDNPSVWTGCHSPACRAAHFSFSVGKGGRTKYGRLCAQAQRAPMSLHVL